MRRLRPVPEPEPIVRFETEPGEQAQFDFAKVKLPWGVRYALVMVLGCSRLLYVEFVPRQTALTVMLGIERAFAVFGGVPRRESSRWNPSCVRCCGNSRLTSLR